MSTFLTQGSYGSPAAAKDSTIQSAVQVAPFIKPSDKASIKRHKDAAELSFSDFQPKRFALNYDPPMISKILTV